MRRVRVEGKSAVDDVQGGLRIACEADNQGCHPQRVRIVLSILNRAFRQIPYFGKARRVQADPTLRDLHNVNIADQCRRWGTGGVDTERLPSDANCLRMTLSSQFVELGESTQVEIVGIKVFGGFADRTFDL